MFARLIASQPDRYGQQIARLSSVGKPEQIAGNIAKHIDQFVADDAVSAAVLLFPDLASLEVLTEVALALGHISPWTIKASALRHPAIGDLVALHIARDIPFGDIACPSEALVLGPFPIFPATRRAPITALEMYVGQPRKLDPKTGDPTTKANLAHIELNLPTHATFETMWDKSIDGRTRSLGGADDRAKAKVSFVIPQALAQQLGCDP